MRKGLGTTVSLVASAGFVLVECAPLRAGECIAGDANCDGVVNNFDIDPFILGLLANEAGFITSGQSLDCWAMRDCWADADQNGHVDNFDIDPFIACGLGLRASDADLCAWPHGALQLLNVPQTQRTALVYVPLDYDAARGDPVVITLHGTDTTHYQEMGPHQRFGYPWPDCGSRTWPELADDRESYPPFAVICPELAFSGSNYAPCVQMRDESHVMATVEYLASRGIISRNWLITGWSSGSGLALVIAMRNSPRFSAVAMRYGAIPTPDELDYNVFALRNCFDRESCEFVTCFSDFNWRDDLALRQMPVLVVTNDGEEDSLATHLALHELTQMDPPFAKIQNVTYPSFGAYPFDCGDPAAPFYPFGGHVEARELAADFFFRTE